MEKQKLEPRSSQLTAFSPHSESHSIELPVLRLSQLFSLSTHSVKPPITYSWKSTRHMLSSVLDTVEKCGLFVECESLFVQFLCLVCLYSQAVKPWWEHHLCLCVSLLWPWHRAHTGDQEIQEWLTEGTQSLISGNASIKRQLKLVVWKAIKHTNTVFLNMLKRPRNFFTYKQKALVSWRTWPVKNITPKYFPKPWETWAVG